MTLEGRIKRLEREWDHPAHPGPDPETVAHWGSLWTAAGMEESQSTALALEFLEYCQMMGKAPAFGYLVMWLEGNIGSGEDGGGSGEGRGAAVY
ncbi:MAG TPA: hypothetical protein EYM65_09970 [Dehalococcoidia bacterium]|nr:hypothetical protein [Dehalococcoidia bacterium]